MTHSIKIFRPTYNQYSDADTMMYPVVALLAIILGLFHAFFWVFPVVGLFTAIPSLVVLTGMLYLGHTHEEKKMDMPERQLLCKYRKLDPEVQAKVPLDISTIVSIGKNEDQFWEVDKEIGYLLNEQKERKKAEARLDPTSVVVLDSIRIAYEEEKQYTHEIRKVLGDFDKAETPQERLRLAEKIRAQLTRR